MSQGSFNNAFSSAFDIGQIVPEAEDFTLTPYYREPSQIQLPLYHVMTQRQYHYGEVANALSKGKIYSGVTKSVSTKTYGTSVIWLGF